MPAPDFDDDPPAGSDPSEGSTVPDDQAPPLRTPDQGADDSGAGAPERPTVAPAASQQNQAPQHSDLSARNGEPSGQDQSDGTWSASPAGPYPGAPNQADQYQSGQYQNAAGQDGSAYPSGPAYPGAQSQPAQNQQYPTGSGPDSGRTGSGPGQSQAIPQPAPAPGFAG